MADTSAFAKNDDFEHSTETVDGFEIQKIKVKSNNEGGQLPLDKGEYCTVFFNRLTSLDSDSCNKLSDIIANELKNFVPIPCESIFIAGLGNRYLTSDTIGTKCAEKLEITRHISIYNEDIFKKMDMKKISSLSPGVMAQTGIETAEIIKGAVSAVKPDVVIVIDSLCARSPDRLASTVQISSSGISPGSGVGNKRKKISEEALGCPVIMLGVPTVVSSSTLVYDALEKADVNDISKDLEEILENGRSYFVTVNEIDELTDKLSDIISDAIFKLSKK